MVTKACHTQNEERLKLSASKVKCDKMKKETYGRKEYCSSETIGQARKWFRSRFGLQPFAGNYTHDKRFNKTEWLCRCKEYKEDESHIISGKCPVYGDLRTNFGDLEEDKNLVSFFTAVLDRRDLLEEEDKMWQDKATAAASSGPGDRERTRQPGTDISMVVQL